ncbi:VWA domain-containing protein [Microlunatus flavus]|uniref:Mg-protoporphyrin IX chelatase n=1 Tax=Microlunatus flavus TaxID=1036181 RepID=A0A1H9NP21_9ACTN|nr:VWA domain-containing protein [Microlunatus flavus]SER37720.1 magnesium chelatase subunit D [Microlunatus flavus]
MPGSPPTPARTARPAPTFPFSAVVGSEDLALALVLTTVSPEVGGVLVRGEKGTAKTTTVRALAAVLPEVAVVEGCRFGCDPAAPDPTCPDGPHDNPVDEGGRPPTPPADVHSLALPNVATTRPARLVELPVGATEDRVIGSLDLRQALGSGEVVYSPGLLAAAHRGLLYVDEVNLLHDHLVDLLLDAAATGRSTVEREGVSIAHASRLVLVGTMNPEEGELRPQLLDRFGLTVEVAAPTEPSLRAEVVRRRMAYDLDPEAFAAAWSDAEARLRHRLADAQARVARVELGDAELLLIAEVCAAFEVDGLRADLVTARAAVAHAAWHGRDRVTKADIRAAARLALPHRRRRNPFDAPGLDEELLDRLLGEDDPPPPEEPPPGTRPDEDETGPSDTTDGADGPAPGDAGAAQDPGVDRQREPATAEADPDGPPRDANDDQPDQPDQRQDQQPGPTAAAVSIAAPGQAYRTRLFTARGVGTGTAGRRSRAVTTTGRTVGSTLPDGEHRPLHLSATVRAAAPHQASRGRTDGSRLRLVGTDLRHAVTEGRESNLVLLAVDASGSMAARKRMEAVKTAVLSLLLDAYQRRDKVGLVTFRGNEAVLALPPTSSVEVAARRLTDLPSGGRTPLAEGLLRAAETLRLEHLRDPRRRPLLVVVTDGRATSGPDAVARSRQAAELLRATGVSALVVDCETGRMSLGLARDLAVRLGADHVRLGEVAAGSLVDAVRAERAALDPALRPTQGRAALRPAQDAA